MGGKTEQRSYDAGSERVWRAVVQVVASLGYTIISSDTQAHVVSFNTGRSFKSWAGQDLNATVLAEHATRSTVVMGGSAAASFRSQGQLFALGEKRELMSKVLAEVERVLPTLADTPPPDTAPQSAVALSEELQRLASLRESGVLSDTEFQLAKGRLLGS